MKCTLEEFIYTYPCEYEYGFTNSEIEEILNEFNIKIKDFNKNHGCNTCMRINDETINYHTDVYQTISNILNNTTTHPLLWD